MNRTDSELIYSATARCPCGAGFAYWDAYDVKDGGGAWDCSDILTGRAIQFGQSGAKAHTAMLPFSFYEIKSERQPSAGGATTRPSGVARQFDPPAPEKKCPTCGHKENS